MLFDINKYVISSSALRFGPFAGSDQSTWKTYDSTELAKAYAGPNLTILIDQGTDDQFLSNLQPQKLREVAATGDRLKVDYREHPGYDHSYFFIATFIEDHIRLHSEALKQ